MLVQPRPLAMRTVGRSEAGLPSLAEVGMVGENLPVLSVQPPRLGLGTPGLEQL